MAWIKPITDEMGVTVTYWELKIMHVDLGTGSASLLHQGWLTQEGKDNGMQPYCSKSEVVDISLLPVLSQLNSQCEQALMALPQFDGATSV